MLRAIYKTGSSLILKNYHDVDVVRFYDTKEERRQALINYHFNEKEDVHFDYVKPLKPFLGCYIYHFMELVEGEDLHLNEFDIFDPQVKKDYVAVLKKFADGLPLKSKWWYHILIACYMYENGSYELTNAQMQAVQRTHDKGITNAKHEYCLKQLNDLSLE